MNRSHSRVSVVVVLLALIVCANLAGRAGAAPSTNGPAIALEANHALSPGAITVDGHGFTPGGRVYLALYDRWGVTLHETRWITASAPAYGPDGSQDPARGFRRGGLLSERFDGLCSATLMARAYDEATQTWSATLDVNAIGSGTATYGLDGSQDPARGYRASC